MTDTVQSFATNKILRGSFASVAAVGTGLTAIVTLPVAGASLLMMSVTTATQAIDDFQIYGQAHPDALFVDITPTSATWATPTTPSWRVKNSSVFTTSSGAYVDGDLNTLATTETGYLEVDVTGLYMFKFSASAAADSASISGYWTLYFPA